ncbi:MAG: cation acetate symporter [Anaeromyxobacter sp.]
MQEADVPLWSWVWLMVGGTFAVYLAVLLWVRTREVGVFYAAERRVSPPLEGMSIAADWISAASFLSLGGAMALSALDGAVYLAGWTGGLLLVAVALAPRLRRSGAASLAQLLGDRFASRGARALAALAAMLVCVLYAAGQLRGAALVLARFAPLPLGAALAVASAGVLLHLTLGGLRTLPQGQAVRYAVLAVAYLAPVAALSLLFTGGALPLLAPLGRLTPEGAALLGAAPGAPLAAAADRAGQLAGLGAWTGSARSPLDLGAAALALVAGTAALPQLLPRFTGQPRGRGGRAAAGWALCFVLLLYSAVPAMALFARGARSAAGPVDPDLLVLLAPGATGLAPWAVALVAAGALAASLATAAGLLPTLGAALARDLLAGALWPRLPESAQRRWARGAAVAGVTAAALLAASPPGPVVQVVGAAFGLAAAVFFPAVLAALFWPGARAGAATAAMGAGLLVTGALLVRWLAGGQGGPSPEAAGALGAAVGGVVLVVGSWRNGEG